VFLQNYAALQSSMTLHGEKEMTLRAEILGDQNLVLRTGRRQCIPNGGLTQILKRSSQVLEMIWIIESKKRKKF